VLGYCRLGSSKARANLVIFLTWVEGQPVSAWMADIMLIDINGTISDIQLHPLFYFRCSRVVIVPPGDGGQPDRRTPA
jgi:hypothetical protein